MAAATPSRLGQINGAGATDALWLEIFAGEVITAFDAANVFLDKHTVRTIDHGKSAQFPATGRISSASYHTPGAELLGQTLDAAERVITIDDLLVADAFIANIDELKNHYDVRAIYSEELGEALSRTFDQNIAQVGVLAARAAATVTGEGAGTKLTGTTVNTDGTALADQIYTAAQSLDENRVPDKGDRNCFVAPVQYYLLAQTTKVINKDWLGSGSYSDGKVYKIANVTLVKTLHMPNGQNITTGPTPYQGDFTYTIALVMNKQAVGTVKLLDLAMESQYDIRRQGTLMVAKYAMGHGILRPEAAVEIATQ